MFQQQSSLPFPPEPPSGDGAAALLRHAAPPQPGVWDELREPGGGLRPTWQQFARALPASPDGLGPELDRRVAQVAREIQRDGVTHNVFQPEGAAARPWSLELLPQLISAADWAVIEAGVEQRAALLEAMLADLYGPQTLLHQGLLPPALVLRHSGYLRPMLGVQPAGGLRLHIVAFDLARAADGSWWVVSQRTQGPSGLGYVLHNRLVISRQFPEAFRELRVQHIASSYRRLLDSVEQRARAVAGGATPRLVLLTPGSYAQTYFEHAYLARYLGLPLVEGGDLVVRDDRLFLKTVEGLEQVHGLLRRVDDDWCDPLELRPDSALGVAGLLQAVRAGQVVMANALGSAFLEAPAVQGFLPAISRRLLGQELQLPAVPTWWCGEEAAWRNVRQRLDDKVLRSTFPREAGSAAMRTVADNARSAIEALVHADPEAWTLQSRMRLSRAPLWGGGDLLPRPAMVRVYAVADGVGRWHVLPGGMTRVATQDDHSVSMQRGGSSLDTWVLTDGPVDTFSMLPQRLNVDDIAARRRPVSSRTGENLFWLGRYTERTEQLVRLARATFNLIDTDNDAPATVLEALSALAVRSALAPPGVPSLNRSPLHFERAVLAALGDAQGHTSIAFNLAALERAAQALRERMSTEQWGLIRSMHQGFVAMLGGADGHSNVLPSLAQVLPALDRLALGLAALTGTQSDRMTRDHGWRLLTVGRMLERLIGVGTQLGCFLEHQGLQSASGIDLMLELFDSAITFRARYQRHEDLLAVADLLVLDTANPRALGGVLRRLRTEIRKLPGSEASLLPLLAHLPAEGAGIELEQLRGQGDAQIALQLATLCVQLDAAGKRLADDIGNRYFAHAQPAQQLQRV